MCNNPGFALGTVDSGVSLVFADGVLNEFWHNLALLVAYRLVVFSVYHGRAIFYSAKRGS
jgi:hypothetical protein